VSGALVLDTHGHVLGVVSEADLLGLVGRQTLHRHDHWVASPAERWWCQCGV